MNILVVQTGFLGDIILSTPVLSNLAAHYPDARISVMTTPLGADLVRHHPAVTEVIEFAKREKDAGLGGLIKVSRELRGKNFTTAFSLHKSYRTAALLALAGIKERIGFAEAKASFLYHRLAKRSDLKHEVLRNLAILRGIGIEPEQADQGLQVHFPESARERFLALMPKDFGKYVVVAPGSVWPTKRWTVSGFASVGKSLVNQGYNIVLVGGPSDMREAHEVEQRIGSGCVNLVGKTSLLEATAAIDQAQLMITNDSAPLHLASARGCPTVAIFCATVPEFGYGPWQTPSVVVGMDSLQCRPCGRHGGRYCPTGTHACQLEITPERVLDAAHSLLVQNRNASAIQVV